MFLDFIGGSQKGCFSDESDKVSLKRPKNNDSFGNAPIPQSSVQSSGKKLAEGSLRKISD